MVSVSIQTLGCKLNQAESEAIADSFRKDGFALVPWGAPADILVLNTCTVTSKAEQKARRIIRKALKDNPDSHIIVTGCYATLDAGALAALDRRRLSVVSGELKSALLALPRRLAETGVKESPGACRTCGFLLKSGKLLEPGVLPAFPRASGGGTGTGQDPLPGAAFAFNPADSPFHSRPFLKIQDGCDHACAYCRARLARGRSVSLDAETVLLRLRSLEERGYAEAVLTGVNICQYRDDSAGDLGGLLAFLLKGSSHIALRLSSLEPEGITPRFLEVLKDPRIRPHFHLSVQSGSDAVLERMGRRYTALDIETGAAALRAVKGDPFLACDIITGFPGEGPEDFERSYGLCKKTGFAWIHAFPYSKRPGTAAASFKNPVSQRDAVSRVEALTDLARQGRAAYVKRWLGKTVEAVPELGGPGRETAEVPFRGKEPSELGYIPAVTDNYLRVLVSPDQGRGNGNRRSIACRLTALESGGEGRFDALALEENTTF
ncbi:MAG: tRNA (N(6)-L-threonylcarbamoyladenosine(37)-C(2))-methylthiotransferase MtaB [Treponema sp.]|jgi:threonylcarbamoyladenosine tRNA methylthiotransferase MtaB|nr:tRNA (N(6)-L-threonylcarbamoyladenosine(37)-C(2))-methylthiotransferase MtaB [Treponema sp.]